MGVQFRGVLFDIGIHIRHVGFLGDKKQTFLLGDSAGGKYPYLDVSVEDSTIISVHPIVSICCQRAAGRGGPTLPL